MGHQLDLAAAGQSYGTDPGSHYGKTETHHIALEPLWLSPDSLGG